MQKNIFMTTILMMMKNKIAIILSLIFISGCNVSPGMYMSSKGNFSNDKSYILLESTQEKIFIEKIADNLELGDRGAEPYKIGNGDQISITVWGLPEIFPISNINPDQNLRRVDSNGKIYFPYVGLIDAKGKTQNELRNNISEKLSNFFTEPQLDVSIARFNSQKVYLLGEVTKPSKINITDIPLSLAEALGEVNGLNTTTSSGADVFIIRQPSDSNMQASIYVADMSSPSSFIDAGNFYLEDNDIVYVNPKSITRWNRVISQFFPFSSFLNSIDNLTSGD